MDDSHFRVGQEYGRVVRNMFKDPSQWVVVPVSAPFLPKRWNLELAGMIRTRFEVAQNLFSPI
jgi:hypothetical protein